MSDEFDCLTCGACCVAFRPGQEAYADTTWTDERKLGPKFVRLNVIRPTIVGMTERGARVPHGAIRTVERDGRTLCVALEGTVGDRVRCSVYARRPRVCRASCEPGDELCRAHRARVGLG